MTAIRLLPSTVVRASLDISVPGAATFNTVIEAVAEGPSGNQITLATVADGTGAGNFTASGNALTFHYEDTVTTVLQFETTLASDADANTLIRVKTVGTPANTLTAAGGDTFSATALTGGGSTSSAAPSITDATAGVKLPFLCDQALLLLQNVDIVTGTTKTATGTLWGFSGATSSWYPIGAINAGGTIAEVISDKLTYIELIAGLRRIQRVYFQIGALGGAGTEIAVYLDCVPADTTTK